jgi:hypothetical protein
MPLANPTYLEWIVRVIVAGLGGAVGFLETHKHIKNDKFKLFLGVPRIF